MNFNDKKAIVGWIISILLLWPLYVCIDANNGWGILLVLGIWLAVAFMTSSGKGGDSNPGVGGPFDA